jgi:hypothetical protein
MKFQISLDTYRFQCPPVKTVGTLTLIPNAKAPLQYFSVEGAGGLPVHFGIEPLGPETLHQTKPTNSP